MLVRASVVALLLSFLVTFSDQFQADLVLTVDLPNKPLIRPGKPSPIKVAFVGVHLSDISSAVLDNGYLP